MKVALKNIKIHHELSEETFAYSADLYLNGKLAAHASNSGHGGCDRYQPIDDDARALLDEAHSFFGRQEVEYSGHTMDNSLELVVGELLNRHSVTQMMRKRMRQHVLFVERGGRSIFEVPAKPAERSRVIRDLGRQYPGCRVLNGLSVDELMSVVRAVS